MPAPIFDEPPVRENPLQEQLESRPSHRRARRASVLALACLGSLAAAVWLTINPRQHRSAPTPQTYTASGYGGYVPVAPKKAAPPPPAATVRPASPPKILSDVPSVAQAYRKGQYDEVIVQAQRLLRRQVQRQSVARRREQAQVRQILAYAFAHQALTASPAARARQMSEARLQFAALRVQAAALPDKGRPAAPAWEPTATLEEEAAFQHAVCTGALGDTKAAEAEYMAFMRAFPESPLVQAALKRIARLHGGDIPSAAEAVWRQAMQTARERTKAREREQSLCGPECLAELLRRRGERVEIHALAREMGTSERGTTMAAFAQTAQRHGLPLAGLALTPAGLARQRLPVVALLSPAHYVLVERIAPDGITLWNPDSRGAGRGTSSRLARPDWMRLWRGVALCAARPGV